MAIFSPFLAWLTGCSGLRGALGWEGNQLTVVRVGLGCIGGMAGRFVGWLVGVWMDDGMMVLHQVTAGFAPLVLLGLGFVVACELASIRRYSCCILGLDSGFSVTRSLPAGCCYHSHPPLLCHHAAAVAAAAAGFCFLKDTFSTPTFSAPLASVRSW